MQVAGLLALLLVESLAWFSIQAPLFIAGLFLVPIAIWCRRTTAGLDGLPISNAPRWLWIWGNDEDGLVAEWYEELHPDWSIFRCMYAWSALRNSVNNMRFVPWISPPLRPELVRCVYLKHGWLAWQGWCVGLLWRGFHIGYNVNPLDALYPQWVSADDWRRVGMGFRTGVTRAPQ